MMGKVKYYVVWKGKKPGIYQSWQACQEQVQQYPEAKFKSFDNKAAAEKAFHEGWKKYWGKASKGKDNVPQQALFETEQTIDYHSISVDVGTHGNPGPVEYKGVDTRSGEGVVFAWTDIQRNKQYRRVSSDRSWVSVFKTTRKR